MWYSIELTLPSRRCIKIISAFEPNLKYLHVTIIAAGVLKGTGGGGVGWRSEEDRVSCRKFYKELQRGNLVWAWLEMFFTLRGGNSKATLLSCLFF